MPARALLRVTSRLSLLFFPPSVNVCMSSLRDGGTVLRWGLGLGGGSLARCAPAGPRAATRARAGKGPSTARIPGHRTQIRPPPPATNPHSPAPGLWNPQMRLLLLTYPSPPLPQAPFLALSPSPRDSRTSAAEQSSAGHKAPFLNRTPACTIRISIAFFGGRGGVGVAGWTGGQRRFARR